MRHQDYIFLNYLVHYLKINLNYHMHLVGYLLLNCQFIILHHLNELQVCLFCYDMLSFDLFHLNYVFKFQ